MSLRILTAENIKQLVTELPIKTLVDHTASVMYRFSRKPEEISCPPRSGIVGERYVTLTMPAQVSELGMSVKVVAVPCSGTTNGKSNGIGGQSTPDANSLSIITPGTTSHQRPGLPATTIVFDEQTGIARAVVNARHLTALRTAAGSLLASQLLLSRPEPELELMPGARASNVTSPPRHVLFWGAGLQIEYHAKLILEGFPSIESCYILNRTPNARATELVETLSRAYPSKHFQLVITPNEKTNTTTTRDTTGDTHTITNSGTDESENCKSTGTSATWFPRSSLIKAADILCFATSATTPLISTTLASYIKPGAHLILIGSYTPNMHEVCTEVIKRASKIVVDSREHAMREAGELIDAGLDGSSDLLELGELIDEDGRPRSELVQTAQKGDITIFKSVGLAVQDVMISRLLCNLAEERSVGTVIEDYD